IPIQNNNHNKMKHPNQNNKNNKTRTKTKIKIKPETKTNRIKRNNKIKTKRIRNRNRKRILQSMLVMNIKQKKNQNIQNLKNKILSSPSTNYRDLPKNKVTIITTIRITRTRNFNSQFTKSESSVLNEMNLILIFPKVFVTKTLKHIETKKFVVNQELVPVVVVEVTSTLD
ncbi:hypothetical protein TVAG_519480, partial [Trichomonas vaginalis G3]